jgi:hypothetical protein
LANPEHASKDRIAEVVRPQKAGPDGARWRFTRGPARPRAVSWFGVRSFWGHLSHFLASAIATNDIDSRDWMHPDDPRELADRAGVLLGAGATGVPLVDALDRDLWIDFVADTGDHPGVSYAVARLVFAAYEVPDPRNPGEHLLAPRGDVLLFGGDTAYPVATADEIHDRLIVPFNRALVERRDGKQRVLLAIPGNHDWYAALDGFGRVFRRRAGDLAPEEEHPSLVPDNSPKLARVADWAEQFIQGKTVTKRKALVLDGYTPIQNASHFALPLTSRLDLYGVDRQLRTLDFRQRLFFSRVRRERSASTVLLLLPDPVYAFLEPSPTGVAMAKALPLDIETERHLVLSGDLHHYSRAKYGASDHVIAGGGGAFLHPARIARRGFPVPDREWPGPIASRRLLHQVPWRMASGRAGSIPHLLSFLFFAPALGLGASVGAPRDVELASAAAATFAAVVCAMVGGWRRGRFLRIAALSAATGVVIGLSPTLVALAVSFVLSFLGVTLGPTMHVALVLAVAIFAGALAFGAFLAALNVLGLENLQAFASLGHPGYRHFVRMRVRRDGSAIDLFCIGLVDPLADGEPPVLVDAFTFEVAGESVNSKRGAVA